MPDQHRPEPPPTAAYDRLAAGYDEHRDTKPANALLERPATLSLLPDVTGDRVLDAGCGAGHLTAALADRGVSAVGLDASGEMLRYARGRVPTASFVRGDLAADLPFGANAFDGVASSLAFHYVRDWTALFADLLRVVRPRGWLVCSVQHPHADFVEYEDAGSYHETVRVSATWESFGDRVEVPAYRRPLEAMLTPALEAGFRLETLREPTPMEAYRQVAPDRYEYENTNPNFLCLRDRAPA